MSYAMSKWRALESILNHIRIEWGGGDKPLTIQWFYVLMLLAEETNKQGWSESRLIQELEERGGEHE